jgi:hypothetical protein
MASRLCLIIACLLIRQFLSDSNAQEWRDPEGYAYHLGTEHFELFGNDPGTLSKLSDLLEPIYEEIRSDLDTDLDRGVNVLLTAADQGSCPFRAMTHFFDDDGTIVLYHDPDWNDKTLEGVLAHEIGHVLHSQVLGRRSELFGDHGLREGIATWAAGKHWLAMLGFNTLADAVSHYRNSGTYLGLADNYQFEVTRSPDGSAKECLDQRDILYTEWAAFVDFLIDRHGLARVLEVSGWYAPIVPHGNTIRQTPLDYRRAFGKTLAELERDWLLEIH